jgi:hypothetical protein
MVDISQPASATEFIAAGASPSEAAILAEQHETLAGRRGAGAQVALSIAGRNQPPPPAPEPSTSHVTQAEATAALDAHTEIQLGAHLDRAFAPPVSAADYVFPASPTQLSDEEFGAEQSLKSALHAEAMPKFVVESIAKALAESSRAVARETPAQGQARIAANNASLVRMWGSDFDANIRAVDNLLETMGARSTALRDFVTRAAPLLDPLSIDLLLQVSKLRAGRH